MWHIQIIVYMGNIKGNLTNNKILTYHIYGSLYEHAGLSNLAMCIHLSKVTKLCQISMLMILIPKEKIRTGAKMVCHYLFSTSSLSRFRGSQLLAICRFYCLKNNWYFFKHDKLNEYTYLTKMFTMIQVIWESSQKMYLDVSSCQL